MSKTRIIELRLIHVRKKRKYVLRAAELKGQQRLDALKRIHW